MASIFQRLSGAFRREPRPQETSPNSSPYTKRRRLMNFITRSPYGLGEEDGGIDDDAESVTYNDLPQRPSVRRLTGRITPLSTTIPTNRPNSELGNVSNNFQSVLPRNNNANAFPISNVPVPASAPIPDPTSTRLPLISTPEPAVTTSAVGTNLNETSSINPAAKSSLNEGYVRPRNQNQRPFEVDPNSNLIGFPAERNRQSQYPLSSRNRLAFSRFQRPPPFATRLPPFRSQANNPNLEFDYPIENVLVDGNISSSTAIKINEAIEHDRFGNAYYTHRYAYEPTTQNITIGNNQRIQRRLIDNPQQRGMRYIREINNEDYYPQQQFVRTRNLNSFEILLDPAPQMNCQIISATRDRHSFPMTFCHFTASALPNDPMRCY